MILEVWKPFGVTSNDFAYHEKKRLQTEKLCYVARLDPMASGKFILLTDEDVKNMHQYLHLEKEYSFDLVLGISTHSHDPYGDFFQIDNVSVPPSKEEIESFLKEYTCQQIPIISSFLIKYRQYKNPAWWFYEHRHEEEIDLSTVYDILPTRKVEIKGYEIGEIQTLSSGEVIDEILERASLIKNEKTQEDLHLEKVKKNYKNVPVSLTWVKIPMTVQVNSGFYIRKLCHDMGEHLKIPAIAMNITRTKFL